MRLGVLAEEGHREPRAVVEIADEAERIAWGNDWRGGANRLRDLLAKWKALPRIDKASDDELWHRYSSARTTYTRRRKQHFAELNEQEGMTMFVVEQNATLALGIADRAYVLEAGRVVLSGSADDLRANDEVRRAYLGF